MNAAALSVARVLPTIPVCMSLYIGSLSGNPHATAFFYHLTRMASKGYIDLSSRYDYTQEFGYRTALNCFRAFLDMQKNGIRIPAFKYEDLVSSPEVIVAEVLKEVGMSNNLVSRAIKAMDVDSQGQSTISQEKMAKLKTRVDLSKIDPELLEDMQQEFEEVGVPGPYDWNGGLRLPGTVTGE